MKKTMFILLLLAVLVAACGPTIPVSDSPADGEFILTTIPGAFNVYRLIDREAKVACWVYSGGGGISCLPLNQTALDGGE